MGGRRVEDKGSNNLGDLTRREFLKKSVEVSAATMYPTALRSTANHLADHLSDAERYYTGVPEDWIGDFEVYNALDEIYIDDILGFEKDRPNALIDVFCEEDSHLDKETADAIQWLLDDIGKSLGFDGVNAIVGRRKKYYPKDTLEGYDGEGAKILGLEPGYEGFVENVLSKDMIEAVIPVVVIPFVSDNPAGAVSISMPEGEDYVLGYSDYNSIVLASDASFEKEYGSDATRARSVILAHEIGHVHGRKHSGEGLKGILGYGSDLMYRDMDIHCDLKFSPIEEWLIMNQYRY